MALVTLKEIADAAKTSIRTVNRALKNQNGISDAKRAEILGLAAEMGYTPNIAARNLRLQRSNFVGILGGLRGQGVFMRKTTDLQHRLELKGFFPVLGVLPDTEEETQTMLREWAGFVSTVVLFEWRQWEPEKVLRCLPQHFIFVDRGNISGFHSLEIDRSSGISDGIKYLVETGKKKIVRAGNIDSREEGFQKAFEALKGKDAPERIHIAASNSEFEDGYNLGRDVLNTGADAVFFDTDRMAFGFLKYAWENNIRIPEKIAVIGFDDDPGCIQSCPALSTVAHPIAEMNDKIVELVERNTQERELCVFSTKFIKRESA
jgi:DNA-binding LacI/PurR family transcriptional regulator